MTITLFQPSTEDKIMNFNLGFDTSKITEFYEYFDKSKNYSASKSIFVDRHIDIKTKFPNTEIFEISYDYSSSKIEVKDALEPLQFIFENSSEDNFKKYTSIMQKTSDVKLNFLYFFIYKNYNPLRQKELFSGLYIPSDKKLEGETLKEIAVLTKIFLTPIEKTRSLLLLSDEFDKKIGYSIKAAMAAIMSRNGSHNIGSHVLSAVSNKINDLGDDKVLFNYIQERMDFIAQITTEVSKWTLPTAFVQDVMRRFYMQRHLLNHISSSEGLTAYEFQKRNEENIPTNKVNNKLIIKILNGDNEIIVGPENNSAEKTLNDFVQIAVPGGIIGQQAFFTILENIIRNTAKHNWANSTFNKDAENLILAIKYIDDPDKDYILFKIYDNVSDVFNGLDIKDDEKEQVALQLLPYDIQEKIPLHQLINKKLICSFIDETNGQLRNENWGLAEIKICAAFLNKKEITEYGLLKENTLFGLNERHTGGFLSAIGEEDSANKYRLCYQFPIPKPKEILIIGKSDFINGEQISIAKQFGVYFSSELPTELDFEIVVLTSWELIDEDKIVKQEKYPFRLILFSNEKQQPQYEDIINKRLIFIQEDFKDYYQDVVENNKNENRLSIWEKIKLSLYEDWLKYFLSRRRIEDSALPLSFYIRHRVAKNEDHNNDGFNEYLKPFDIEKDCQQKLKPILIKYEEDIETLPIIFRGKLDNVAVNRKYDIDPCDIVKSLVTHGQENKSKIQLKRHFAPVSMEKNNNECLYQESLSGSQIYFNLFETQLSFFQKNKFLLQILENALICVAIIDERYLNHYEKNPSDHHRKKAINNANIFTFHKFVFENKTKNLRSSQNTDGDLLELNFDELIGNEYDALIIHQTILDEFFDNDLDSIEGFCAKVKKKIPLVTITSGRGKPDKLPQNAKFLPFSNLDSFLIKEYHEKFLLTQAILKLTREHN